MAHTGTCPHCGALVIQGNRFCANCGQNLEQGEYQSGTEHEFEGQGPTYGEAATDDLLAEMGPRVGGVLVTRLLPGLVAWIPVLGWIAELGLIIWNLVLMRRGQDIGAKLFGLRVVRDTGELAGFFHMWTRNLAAIISTVVVFAGYWTAFFDPHRRTWHDRMLGTYVVQDSKQMESRPGTSSSAAVAWFWISLVLGIGAAIWVVSAFAEAVSDWSYY